MLLVQAPRDVHGGIGEDDQHPPLRVPRQGGGDIGQDRERLPPGSGATPTPSFAQMTGGLLQPVLAPIGMTPELTVSLFFGFIAKEILLGAMAVIHHTSGAGLGPALRSSLSPLQALSFMTFTLLYTPCLSTVAAQLKESRNRGFVALSVGWSLALAWVMAFTVYQGGMLLQRAFSPPG